MKLGALIITWLSSTIHPAYTDGPGTAKSLGIAVSFVIVSGILGALAWWTSGH